MRIRGRKIGTAILLILLIGLVGSAVYNVYDNQRFIVVEQKIDLERLPLAFKGFRILQISDLHGRYFGDHQADLIRTINSIDYDMIAFTGDMNASTTMNHSEENSKAILELLEGIENKEYLFWVDGNTGPYTIESDAGARTGNLTEIGTILQERGCKILTLPYAINRGVDRIWITPEMSEITFDAHYRSRPVTESSEPFQAFYRETYADFQAIKGNGEVKIMLNHTPLQTNLTAEERKMMGHLDYDLILAGHYHGGQIRLPLIGALYIPSPTEGISGSGLFPAQEHVKGISYYGDAPQYVSAGLGSSGHVRWTNFRLFNTPEINLIILN